MLLEWRYRINKYYYYYYRQVCITKLDDIQLAMVVARLHGNDLNEMVPARLRSLLYEKCLGCDADGQNR